MNDQIGVIQIGSGVDLLGFSVNMAVRLVAMEQSERSHHLADDLLIGFFQKIRTVRYYVLDGFCRQRNVIHTR